jgi:chromosome segregation ATPase
LRNNFKDGDKSSMEYGQNLDRLEEQIAESSKKIEHLATLVHDFTSSSQDFEVSSEQNPLTRIESKLDIIAQSDLSEYIDLFLSELKQNLESKQEFLSTKIASTEEVMKGILGILKDDNVDETLLNELKAEISNVYKQGQTNIESLSQKISEISDLLEQARNTNNIDVLVDQIRPLIEKIDNTDRLKEDLEKFDSKLIEISELIEKSSKFIPGGAGRRAQLRGISPRSTQRGTTAPGRNLQAGRKLSRRWNSGESIGFRHPSAYLSSDPAHALPGCPGRLEQRAQTRPRK